ncbi:MAG: HRDC domain-containing protein, partial [Planctomycetota bacterium]
SRARAAAAPIPDHDSDLFDRLRAVRRELADARQVPAYVIFSDATLRQMAADRPRTQDEFRHISGVGEKKLAEFAETFLAAIATYLRHE